MRAVVFAGEGRVRVDEVPEPRVQGPTDAIVGVRRAAICASDLHVLSGKTPGMREGGVIGHEFVGVVQEAGDEVAARLEGARVVGSFLIACGACEACRNRRFNFCASRRALGLGSLVGDLEGAQAELVRVPDAHVNLKTLDGALAGLSDEEALFAGDIMATGFYGASLARVAEGEVVLVVGAGPVGLFSALAGRRTEGARVLVGDLDDRRVELARGLGLEGVLVPEESPEAAVGAVTEGRLPDAVIEAVGAVPAFRTAMRCVRDGGRIAVVGVYGAERYELPMGRAWIRGLDIRFAGMANVQAYWDECLIAAAKGELDPSALITHRLPLERAEEGYDLFASHEALKVVFTL